MSRLKILFITAWYPTEESPTDGIFVREHARAVSLYNEVVVIYPEGPGKAIKGLYEYSDQIEESIRTIRIHRRRSPIPKTNWLVYYWSIIRVCRCLFQKGFRPDVIHAHVYIAGLPAVILGILYKTPVVITEHWSLFIRQPPIRGIQKQLARFVMNYAKFVLPVSEYLRRHIAAIGVHTKFKVLPNTVNINLFRPLPQTAKAKETKRILLVANLIPQKGIPYLLKALFDLANARRDFMLDIIGDGPRRDEYEQMLVKLGLLDRVCFQGVKSMPEIAGFMQQSDFFVLPSVFETFGVVLIEALAAGKPVIATNIGGPDEIVTSKVGLLVPPKDALALTKAINYMLDHYQDYNPEELARYVRERFSYEAIGKQFNEIYQQITKSIRSL